MEKGLRQGFRKKAMMKASERVPAKESVALPRSQSSPMTEVRRGTADPLLQLQRIVGNRAVGMMLGKPRSGDPRPEDQSSDQARSGSPWLARIGSVRGQPLDAETRTELEAQFGADFSSVRVHTDDSAAAATRRNDALALTTGSDVYFESGAYAPRTRNGRALLAHELSHVVQQSRRGAGAGATASAQLEREARQAATTPAPASVTAGAAPAGSVQLAAKGEPPTTTTPIAGTTPSTPDRRSIQTEVVDDLLAELDASQPFSLDVSARRASAIASGERPFSLEQPSGFDIDEPLPVGEKGLKPQRAVARALDPHNRTLHDTPTNRRTKHLRISRDAVVRHRTRLPKVSLTKDPAAVFTRRFSEVAELHQVFDEAVARVGNINELRPTEIKARINANIREIIREGSTPAGATVRDTLRAQGFEWVPDRGIVAVRSPLVTPAGAPPTTTTLTAAEVKATPSAIAAEALPVKADALPGGAPEAVAEGGSKSGLQGAAIEEGLPAARLSRRGFTLRKIGGVAAEFAIWLMIDYILTKWGEARDRAKIAELMATNVEPAIAQRLAELNDEAQRLTAENPYATVYANVTAHLRYRGMADEYEDKREGIEDVSFGDLKLSLQPTEDQTEGKEVTRIHNRISGNRHYEITRTVTVPLPLQFPETPERLEARRLRFSAQKLVAAGIAARAYAEMATFWSEGTTESFVQAYIEASTGQQRDDAVKYLEELRKRPPGWRSRQRSPVLLTPSRSGATIERARP